METKVQKISWYQKWAREFSKKTWGKEFNLPVEHKLKHNNYGSFRYSKLRNEAIMITLNIPYIVQNKNLDLSDNEKVLDTLKHELCHWYCFTEGLQFSDGQPDFERELYKVGASSTHNRSGELGREYQLAVINGEITRNGNKNIEYREEYDPSEEFNMLACDTEYEKYQRVQKGYAVYYKDEYMGSIFKISKYWVGLGNPEYEDSEDFGGYWYTRKKLATTMVNATLEKRGEKKLVV